MALSMRARGLLVLLCAFLLVVWARWYVSHMWTGVLVSGAGDPDTNGYYERMPGSPAAYAKTWRVRKSWRVPNIFDLVASRPRGQRRDLSLMYILRMSAPQEWRIIRDKDFQDNWDVLYINRVQGFRNPEGYPPSTGWQVFQNGHMEHMEHMEHRDNLDHSYLPAPEVKVHGNRDDYRMYNRGGTEEMMASPSTTILLACNAAVAYNLWSRQVSPDAVAISYSAIWEAKEYWRVVTASFSHFEILHFALNMMGLWNQRHLERLIGSFSYLFLSLDLVVMTLVMVIVIQHVLVRYRGQERYRDVKAVGYSCVLFANMVCFAVAQKRYCPIGRICFETYSVTVIPGWPPVPVNGGPFALLFVVQVIMPRAGFLGHFAGIILGYPMAWHLLDGVSTPILAGVCAIAMLHHSKGWARQMPDYTLLLQAWAAGEPGRVSRTKMLRIAFSAHLALVFISASLFTLGVMVAELLAAVVGYNAVQAMKCCCCAESVPAEHKYCVRLLKAYGILCCILLVTDLMSIGGILGQWDFLIWSGVSSIRLGYGLLTLVGASVMHAAVVAGCIGGMLFFRDGQTFLTSVGLGQLVRMHSISVSSSVSYGGSVLGSANQGVFFRGGGRTLGSQPTESRSLTTASGERGGEPSSRAGATDLSNAAAAAIRRSGGNPGSMERGGVRGRGQEEPLLREENERQREDKDVVTGREIEV